MEMKSKYLARFARLDHKDLPLQGNRVLVEVLPQPEIKTASGFIVQADMSDHRTTTAMNRADLCIVLAVGDGYLNEETGELEPLELKPGNVVLISRAALKLYSQYPGLNDYTKETIAMIRDVDAHVPWQSIEHFQEYSKKLNENA